MFASVPRGARQPGANRASGLKPLLEEQLSETVLLAVAVTSIILTPNLCFWDSAFTLAKQILLVLGVCV